MSVCPFCSLDASRKWIENEHAIAFADGTWRLKRIDDVPVWSISCLYVRKGYRRKGITSVLIEAAVKAARAAGAPAIEAYPLDANLTPSASGTGYASTFAGPGSRSWVNTRLLARSCARSPNELSSGRHQA